jgi:hypothetical protein
MAFNSYLEIFLSIYLKKKLFRAAIILIGQFGHEEKYKKDFFFFFNFLATITP